MSLANLVAKRSILKLTPALFSAKRYLKLNLCEIF